MIELRPEGQLEEHLVKSSEAGIAAATLLLTCTSVLKNQHCCPPCCQLRFGLTSLTRLLRHTLGGGHMHVPESWTDWYSETRQAFGFSCFYMQRIAACTTRIVSCVNVLLIRGIVWSRDSIKARCKISSSVSLQQATRSSACTVC